MLKLFLCRENQQLLTNKDVFNASKKPKKSRRKRKAHKTTSNDVIFNPLSTALSVGNVIIPTKITYCNCEFVLDPKSQQFSNYGIVYNYKMIK